MQAISNLARRIKVGYASIHAEVCAGWRWGLMLVGLCGVYAGSAAIAGVPQPMCIYYGQARDGFGWPYQQNAEVILYANETEVYRYSINGSIEPGINFILRAFLDDGTDTESYANAAVKATDTLTIKVLDQYGLQTLVETNAVPPADTPGDIHKIFITAGNDSDGDGLSDQWEQEMIDWLNDPTIQTLADIRPEDDSDNDGASNLHEYRSGTFAFLDYDYFGVKAMTQVASDRMRIDIFSVPGKSYSVQQTDSLLPPNWQTVSFALEELAPVDNIKVEGDGDWMSFYVTVSDPLLNYFRVLVE